jgi:predicted acyl esterase
MNYLWRAWIIGTAPARVVTLVPAPGGGVRAQDSDDRSSKEEAKLAAEIRARYTKYEFRIPMRDSVKLFTTVYVPKDAAASKTYPFLMERTPYSVAPYGPDNYSKRLGPAQSFVADGFIFVYQDVRGRYQSEGVWLEMTPHKDVKKGSKDVDESTDTYDTIDWLLKNVPSNNGKVGIYGISYPGFYAAAAMPDSHPALKACSPQAPVTDLYMGDDAYHNGAFMLAQRILAYFAADWTGYRGMIGGFKTAPMTVMNLLKMGAISNARRTSERYELFLGRSGAAYRLRRLLEIAQHFYTHEKRALRGDGGGRFI